MQVDRRLQLEKMIARTALGDRDAFANLYEATSSKLHAVCVSVLKDRTEAEEALQEVYIKVWQNAGRYASNGLSPMTWLISISRNRAIDRLRARNSRPPASSADDPLTVVSGAPGPEAITIQNQERVRLNDCLSKLEDAQAGAVRAVYLEGISYADLAEREGIPINTARSWLRRSLLRLRECVGQ